MGITFFIPFINIIMALAFIINLIIQYYTDDKNIVYKAGKIITFLTKKI